MVEYLLMMIMDQAKGYKLWDFHLLINQNGHCLLYVKNIVYINGDMKF